MAILGMVERHEDSTGGWSQNRTCKVEENFDLKRIEILVVESKSVEKSPEESIKFNWSEKTVGLINSAFYIGYVPMIVPMTIVGQKIGFYNFINFAIFGNILTTGFFPTITIRFGATGAIVMRILCGIIQSACTSILSGSLFYWSLRKELTVFNGFIQLGGGLGLIISGIFGGAVLQTGAGWETIFHYSALSYIPIFIIFLIKASDKPEDTSHALNFIRPFRFSNKINKEELFKLVNDRESQNEQPFAPWKKIILNRNVWLYCLAWFCACFNLSVFTIFPQRYYQLFLGTSIGKITKVFGIQATITMILMMLMSLLTDTLRKRLPTPAVRKLFFAISSTLTVFFGIGINFYPCWENFVYASVMICCILCSAILTCACKPISNEMGGKYAAQIYAFSNSVSQVAGIIAPILIGRMLSKGPIDQFETWINPGLSVIGVTILGMIGFQLATLTLLPFTSSSPPENNSVKSIEKNLLQ